MGETTTPKDLFFFFLKLVRGHIIGVAKGRTF